MEGKSSTLSCRRSTLAQHGLSWQRMVVAIVVVVALTSRDAVVPWSSSVEAFSPSYVYSPSPRLQMGISLFATADTADIVDTATNNPDGNPFYELSDVVSSIGSKDECESLSSAIAQVGRAWSEDEESDVDTNNDDEKSWSDIATALESVSAEIQSAARGSCAALWKEYCNENDAAESAMNIVMDELAAMSTIEGCMSIGPLASLPHWDAIYAALSQLQMQNGDECEDIGEGSSSSSSETIEMRAVTCIQKITDWIEAA